MEKHAYLIIANKNWRQVELLLNLIDDIRNDIYLMIDKKAKLTSDEQSRLKKAVTKSKLMVSSDLKIYWGGVHTGTC